MSRSSVLSPLLTLLEQLAQFQISRFWIEMKIEKSGYLPDYLGSALRGAFGHAFKRSVCLVSHQDCERCLLRTNCPYTYIFETYKPEQATWMAKYEKVPHPFIMHPPQEEKNHWQEGELLIFGITLFGQAANLLPHLILSWEKMGQGGLGVNRLPLSLQRVLSEDLLTQEKNTIYQAHDHQLKHFKTQSITSLDPIEPAGGSIQLTLQTPCRLNSQGKLLTQHLPFEVLASSLLRRLSMLAYFHGACQVAVPFSEIKTLAQGVSILEHTLHWKDFVRYSNRQKQKMNLGGLLGTVTYDDTAQDFWPLLWLGQLIHIGKNTSFGLGQYRFV